MLSFSPIRIGDILTQQGDGSTQGFLSLAWIPISKVGACRSESAELCGGLSSNYK